MANMAVSRIKREFKEVLKSEEVMQLDEGQNRPYCRSFYSHNEITFFINDLTPEKVVAALRIVA